MTPDEHDWFRSLATIAGRTSADGPIRLDGSSADRQIWRDDLV